MPSITCHPERSEGSRLDIGEILHCFQNDKPRCSTREPGGGRITLFSPKTQHVLAASGWSPERCVDLSNIITKLSKEGFDIFEAALVVLQSLQGLQTRTPTGASMDFSATIGLGTYDDIRYRTVDART